jgi:hypothetical protein
VPACGDQRAHAAVQEFDKATIGIHACTWAKSEKNSRTPTHRAFPFQHARMLEAMPVGLLDAGQFPLRRRCTNCRRMVILLSVCRFRHTHHSVLGLMTGIVFLAETMFYL